MTHDSLIKNTEDDARKPCIALMGEFSAGKSTLANLLIGANPLPVQIVATQLPPVRISYGRDRPYKVGLDGQREEIDLDALGNISLSDAAHLQIFAEQDMLQHCDLMDMPGISDPNMASEVWERMIGEADGILWCSHATQAWRQSEAAVWAEIPSEVYAYSLLLLTRSDKLRDSDARARVVSRVRRETDGLFRDVIPISLLLAVQEAENHALWGESGAAELARALVALLTDINRARTSAAESDGAAEFDVRLPGLEGPEAPPGVATEVPHEDPGEETRVVPRRIQRTGAPSQRPEA